MLGADAVGLVFYDPSPRAVSPRKAAELCEKLPAFLSVVALFVDPRPEDVREVLQAVPAVNCLQFHGTETPEFCRAFDRPYMKALRVRDGIDPGTEMVRYPDAAAILLDSYDPERAGGTGRVFDWGLARQCVERGEQPIVLAGGLKPENVAQAIGEVRPWALDVSSGVESAAGVKSAAALQAFFKEVYRVQFAG